MKIIKLALISFVILFGLITLISLAIPSRIRISKAVNLAAPRDTVRLYLKDTARWPEWNPLFINRGTGPVTTSMTPLRETPSEVVMKLQVGNSRPVTSVWELHTYATTDSLTLQWYLDFQLKWYPWEKFGSMFYEGSYGAMMEEGLNNLKREVER